jgi:N-acyl-phosphatidylethanolamine-hydrolysing phospholipase D
MNQNIYDMNALELFMNTLSISSNLYRRIFAAIGFFFIFGCAVQPVTSQKPHHTPNGFRNLYINDENSFWDFLRWQWQRIFKNIPGRENYQFEIAKNNPEFLKSNNSRNTITWIGHATVLLQLNGKNILTDPLFSQRSSPVQWAGPKRVVPPGISMENLPPIHMVLISHDHYDALDEPSIMQLFKRPGGKDTLFFVPLGLRKWFNKRGITHVFEMDWWDNTQMDNFSITAVPVQHWSKRNPFSRNRTLWAGWVVEVANFRFFFAGDSGYCPHFKQIGEKFGKIDLAAIPIGAYEPRWFMAKHHISPEESVKVHQDIRAEKSIGIHWGTFILTDEPLNEPPQRLAEAVKNAGLKPEAFVVLKHGETIPFKQPLVQDS